MEKQKNNLLDLTKSILEFMKGNPTRFNAEQLEIMCNMHDYINNYISDQEAIIINKKLQAIKKTLISDCVGSSFGKKFNDEFNKRDFMTLATIFFMALTKNKEIYMVDDDLIYYVINSLRGEEYKCYSSLLRGVLYPRLLEGVKLIQQLELITTDPIRLAFNTLVDRKIVTAEMNEEEFEEVMEAYLEKRSILLDAQPKRKL